MRSSELSFLIAELRTANPALFVDVPHKTLMVLGKTSRRIELAPGQQLFGAGEPLGDVYFFIAGAIKRSITLPTGTESVVEIVKSPRFFPVGEMFNADCHISCATALTSSLVIGFPVVGLRERIRSDSQFALCLFEAMARRQCEIEFEMVQQHTSTGVQRVLDYLMKLAGDRMGMAGETTVRLESSKKLIASRIGMTPESFSRALHQLVESGAIVVDGRTVHIQNAALGVKGTEGGPTPMSFARKPKSEKGGAAAVVAHPVVINLCGRQRFLSQRMATAWAMIGRKLTLSTAKVQLRQLSIQAGRNLARLDTIVVDAPTRSKLARLKEIWPAYHRLLVENPPESGLAPDVLVLSEQVLHLADKLTAEAERCAGTLEGHLVNVAGRNRMLSARITKLFLFHDWGIESGGPRDLMHQSRREFEKNIEELTSSGPQLPECGEQLLNIGQNWKHFTLTIDGLPAENRTLRHTRAVLAASEALMRQLDATVKMYERLADPVGGARPRSPRAAR